MKKLSLLMILALPALASASTLQVQSVKGGAFFSQGSHQPSTPLVEKSYLSEGSFIRTEGNGSTFISPFPYSTVYFGAMSDAQFVRLVGAGTQDGYSVNQVDADLYSGKITAFINNHGKQGTEFTLRTSAALINANSAIFVVCVSDVGLGVYVVRGSVTITPLSGNQRPQVLRQNNGTEIRSPTGLVRPVAFTPNMSADSLQCLRTGMTRDILDEGQRLVGTSNLEHPLQNFSNYFRSGPDDFNLDELAPVSPTE